MAIQAVETFALKSRQTWTWSNESKGNSITEGWHPRRKVHLVGAIHLHPTIWGEAPDDLLGVEIQPEKTEAMNPKEHDAAPLTKPQ